MKVTEAMYMLNPNEHQKHTSFFNIYPNYKSYSNIPFDFSHSETHPHNHPYNLLQETPDKLQTKPNSKSSAQDAELYNFLFETTKDSESSHEPVSKKGFISQKKSYKKAPQGKMDASDESLLLTLASKYKHDWKKVSKKIFKLNKKKIGPNLLRIRYKELAPDLTQKRVRFTHEEDLKIIKYYTQYGYDWEKIAENFESRTAIMVKNRFYHIKKKNILDKLLNEVESQGSNLNPTNPNLSSQSETLENGSDFVQTPSESEEPKDDQEESIKFFMEKGENLVYKTVMVQNLDNYFDFEKKEDQLYEKITPMEDFYSDDRFIDYGYDHPYRSNMQSFPYW
jgi:hypothetical protein